MEKKHYPVAFIILIGLAFYIMYSDAFKPKIDLLAYKEACHKYLDNKTGFYPIDEMKMLVAKVNYLFPAAAAELKNPLEVEIKSCSEELEKRLNK